MNKQVSILIVLAGILTVSAAAGDAEKSSGVKAELVKVQDVRRVKLAGHKSDSQSFDFNKPGLELSFRLTPPSGKTVVKIEQPQTIKAKDSMNNDLTKVEAGFMGRHSFVSLEQSFNGPPNSITITLGRPHRSATSFDLATSFTVWAFDSLDEITFKPEQGEAELDAKLLGEDVTCQITQNGSNLDLKFTPGDVKHRIESIHLSDDGRLFDDSGAMWNDQMVSYSFPNTTLTRTLRVVATKRSGMKSYPCKVAFKKQPLP